MKSCCQFIYTEILRQWRLFFFYLGITKTNTTKTNWNLYFWKYILKYQRFLFFTAWIRFSQCILQQVCSNTAFNLMLGSIEENHSGRGYKGPYHLTFFQTLTTQEGSAHVKLLTETYFKGIILRGSRIFHVLRLFISFQ